MSEINSKQNCNSDLSLIKYISVKKKYSQLIFSCTSYTAKKKFNGFCFGFPHIHDHTFLYLCKQSRYFN